MNFTAIPKEELPPIQALIMAIQILPYMKPDIDNHCTSF